jgi:poly(3-hydroxybutyrate) depolymerase
MDTQRHERPEPTWKADGAKQDARQPRQETDARAKAEQAARAVMHPEGYDREWRFYHGAWGG